MTTSQEKQSLLLFGALGFIGTHITNAIVARRSEFNRIVIFTSASTASKKAAEFDELKKKDVEVIVGDIENDEDILAAFEGITTILSFAGRTGLTSQLHILTLALSTHANTSSLKHFIPSEYGTDIEFDSSSATEPTHQLKLKVRSALRAQSKLSYTFIVTGPYIEGYLSRPSAEEDVRKAGGYDVKERRAWVIGDGKGEVGFCSMPDVGTFTVLTLLLTPSQTYNRALIYNSFTSSPLAIINEFERQTSEASQTGGEKWQVTHTPLNEIKELEKRAYEEKSAPATLFTLRRIWAEGKARYSSVDNEILGEEGKRTETLESMVRRQIEKQRGG